MSGELAELARRLAAFRARAAAALAVVLLIMSARALNGRRPDGLAGRLIAIGREGRCGELAGAAQTSRPARLGGADELVVAEIN